MAIGIPLTSLDVVVGISGVHYVLQGMKQIDREMSAMSGKRVSVAMDTTSLGGGLRNVTQQSMTTMSAMRNLGKAVDEVGQIMRTPMYNPANLKAAKQTIEDYKQQALVARQLGAEASAAARKASEAEKTHNAVLKERNRLQGIYNGALKSQQTVAAEVAKLTKDLAIDPTTGLSGIHANYTTTTAAGIKAAALASGAGTAAQMAAAQLTIDSYVKAAEIKAATRLASLTSALPMMAGATSTAAANLAAGPTAAQVGMLASVAAGARANATALGNQASAARVLAAHMAGAASGARSYIASIAGAITPMQMVTGLFHGLVGIAGSVFGVIKTIGSLGMAAGGAAINVGKFIIDILRIPAISGTLTGGLSTIAENFRSIATAVGLVISTLVGLSFKEIISEGMDFEQAMSDIKAVAQYSVKGTAGPGETQQVANLRALTDQMERLDYITLKLGADSIFSNTEVANAIETLIRGGVEVGNVTEDTVNSILDLASATKSSPQQSSQAVAGIMNMFGATGEQIPHYVDLIAGALNTTVMTMDDFTSAMRQLGPLAQALGISFEDTTTLLAQVGLKGYVGEQAGTSLRNMLLYLNPKTKPAIQELKDAGLWSMTGSTPATVSEEDQIAYNKKMQDYNVRMQNYQRDLAEFRAGKRQNQPIEPTKPTAPKATGGGETGHSFAFDDQGNLRSLPDIIRDLQTHTKGMSDEDLSMFSDRVFGKRSGSASLLLTKEDADQFQKTKELIESVKAADVAAFRLENVRGKIELLTGSLKSLASVVFINWLATPLLNMFNRLIEPANRLLYWFGKKVDPNSALGMLAGNQSRGKFFFQQLGEGLKTGDLGKAWVNMMATLPEGTGGSSWGGRIRQLMRWLQLGRDAVITFAEAFTGKWRGALTEGINPLIRVIGIMGTYWGTIWKGVKDLVSGESTFRQFVDTVLRGFQRLSIEAGGFLKVEWPKVVALLRTGWEKLVDLGAYVWDTYLHPAITFLWDEAKKALTSEENKKAVSDTVRGWFGMAEDFWKDTAKPWIGGILADLGEWLGKPETATMVSTAIGTLLTTAFSLVQLVVPELPLDWKLAIGAFGLTRAVAGATTAGLIAGLTLGLAGLAPSLVDTADGFNKFWEAALDPTQGGQDKMGKILEDVFKPNSVASVFVRMGASFVMLGELLGASLLNGVIWASQRIIYIMVKAAELIKLITTGSGFSQEQWKTIDQTVKNVSQPVPVNFDWATGAARGDFTHTQNNETGNQDPRLQMGQGKGAAFNVVGWLANNPVNNGNGPRMIDEYDPLTGAARRVDEKYALPRRQNPVTDQMAPEGFLWLYNPAKLAWELSNTSDPMKPQVNPYSGDTAPAGFKWVFDGLSGKFVLYPIGMQDVPTAVPDRVDTTPDGMYWVWDQNLNTFVLVWAGQAPPATKPRGLTVGNVMAAAAAYANEPYDDAGNPNPNYVPPLNPPGYQNGTTGRAPAPVTISVDATGLTDEMFLNKLTDRLQAKWQQLNGMGATA